MSLGPSYPDTLEIQPFHGPPRLSLRVPGSKSITNRALVLAAMFSQRTACTLRSALSSEDTEVMIDALKRLGFRIDADWTAAQPTIQVHCVPGSRMVPAGEADLFVGNSGTTMRFLTALVSLGEGHYRLDGVPRMRERPIEDLLAALRQLGVRACSENGNGCPPVVIEADGLRGGPVRIRGDASSQFLSGLLMAAPFARAPVKIDIEGELVSWPYVAMTLEMLRRWGVEVEAEDRRSFRLPQANGGGITDYAIEPDASAASYFFAAAAISGGHVRVDGLHSSSLQGDTRFVNVLEQMGCSVTQDSVGLAVQGGRLHGIDVDMNDISDTVMTLAAVACFADGPTAIRHVGHIRHKETDRLAALTTELRRLGATVAEFSDGLTIRPQPLHGVIVETYNDHRMAMSLALVGLKVPGVVIRNPSCVAKTYPGFFDDLSRLSQSGESR